jgi:hypothetical protein
MYQEPEAGAAKKLVNRGGSKAILNVVKIGASLITGVDLYIYYKKSIDKLYIL